MNTFGRFFYEIMSIVFGGLYQIFKSIWEGLKGIFSIEKYTSLINNYAEDFTGSEWVLVVLTIAILVIIVGLIIFIVAFLIRKYIRFRKTLVEQEDLLDEIGDLNNEVANLVKENERILAMKVSQLGLKPNEPATEEAKTEGDGEELEETVTDGLRFPQLSRIDSDLKNTSIVNYNNNQNLEQLVDDFRCFAASKLHLYYDASLLRVFFAGLACGKMIILQGISGTGKTSLAYAWSKFNTLTPCVSSVQPSWRDRSDFFGYLNEFTKKFNETDALVELYTALYDDRIHTIILDEMNLARVEYYFAEVLSILEMPSRAEWLVSLVTDKAEGDPVKLDNGKLRLGGNIWYIGTINNDDSTFMVTDKVYDRAMPIDINTKVDPFDCRFQDAIDLNSEYLESLFKKACEDHPISEKNLKNVGLMDDYVIKHFRIAFGNRIMKQLKTFVPVYVACGGDEVDAIDYFIAKKILRKFEQLNIAYIRDEFDPFIKYLHELFGEHKMFECVEYMELLKKND